MDRGDRKWLTGVSVSRGPLVQTGPMGDDRLEGLRSQLEGIAEELAGIGYDKLKEAIETGDGAAAAEERRLGRARRSVLKAAALLASGSDEWGK